MPRKTDDEIDAAGLLGAPVEMLDVAFDQLRTLAVVHVTGTVQRAARDTRPGAVQRAKTARQP